MKTTQKPVTVSGRITRTGIMTVKNTNRKRNAVTVEIHFTSNVATRKAEKYFWIDANSETDAVEGLAEQFRIQIV